MGLGFEEGRCLEDMVLNERTSCHNGMWFSKCDLFISLFVVIVVLFCVLFVLGGLDKTRD